MAQPYSSPSSRPPRSKKVATGIVGLLAQRQQPFMVTWADDVATFTIDPAGTAETFTVAANGQITYGTGDCSKWHPSSWRDFMASAFGIRN